MSLRVFDQEHYGTLNAAREAVLVPALTAWQTRLALSTAADVGCGLGHFSAVLARHSLMVTGMDGREENIAECRRRWPNLGFHRTNIEEAAAIGTSTFDLVLCFGLLYHLENPFAAIRNLHAMTNQVLVIESMCIPSVEPVFALRDESQGDDQGLHYVALYPSESALIKALYRAGFSLVYRFHPLPDHADFHESRDVHQVRTMLAASRAELNDSFLRSVQEPANPADPWHARGRRPQNRLQRFLGKPWSEKLAIVRRQIS